MGQALYRKYRSKALSEIVGQEHITETLDKALKSGRISHAYLFTGPRGVGKTSIARILAHEINGLPYDDSQTHMDVIEIDAASNNGVEDIRDLREKAAVAPTSAKYKVYIIDEVHMLSKAAFNALLKTLEEPPAHIVFILATTDAHKLPATIISRTQRYTFKPVSQEKVIAHLKVIAEAEGIKADDAALTLLAAHGEGSFRDSISMLDQASGQGGRLTLEFVQVLLGIPPGDAVSSLISAVREQDGPATARLLITLYDQGFQAAAIAKVIAQTLRQQFLAGSSTLSGEQLLSLLGRLLEVPAGYDPERLLEIVLLEAAGVAANPAMTIAPEIANSSPPIEKALDLRTVIETEKPKPADNKLQPKPEKKSKPAEALLTTVASTPIAATPTVSVVDATIWPNVLAALKQKYNTLYGVVRMAVPTFEGKHLELAFAFAFHQKRLTDPKNKKILADIIYDLNGQALQITCVVRKDNPLAGVPLTTRATAAPVDISAISDIFGGGEII